MKKRYFVRMFMLLALLQMSAAAATYTVAKDGSGQYTSIQAAIDAAGENDEVVILDKSVYEEQVTIDSTKSDIILRSAGPSSVQKPVITYCDRMNIHPVNMTETKSTETITYNRNGALRIICAKRVKIEGVTVDGGGRAPFAYPAVWGGIEPLFHGNAAIVLCKSGDVVIRDCEVRNAYFGIYCHDRNQGGVFAYAEEPMVFPEEVVPFSGFAQVGNHLIEHNRICNNTWGIYFESLWDLGSTVRHNLFYENHHENNDQAAAVAKMPGGGSQAGGAIVFKDANYTNVVIHNNTFYHNYLLFAALGGSGAQHLVFNNIYSEPWRLWKNDPVFPNPPEALDPYFVNRMFNSIYSCQAETPETTTVAVHDSVYDDDAGAWVKIDTTVKAISRVRIMNGMEQVKPGMTISMTVQLSNGTTIFTKTIPDVIEPGNLITASNMIKPFPEASNVRWVEIPFLSTDPASADFLVPDPADERVKRFVKRQGWEKSGVVKADGSREDIGAVPRWGTVVAPGGAGISVRAMVPTIIYGTKATLTFTLAMEDPTLTKLEIHYIGAIGLNENNGKGTSVIPAENISYSSSSIETFSVKKGGNTVDITLPVEFQTTHFHKMVFQFCITGRNSSGQTVVSSVAQIPYAALDYYLTVEVLDAGLNNVNSVVAGETYQLRVTPYRSGGERMNILMHPFALNLGSVYDLFTPDGIKIDTISGGISGDSLTPVVFHTVPVGGIDQVLASGKYGDLPFLGASDDIHVLPGAIDHPVCQMPMPSILPGQPYPLVVKIFDKYNNLIGGYHEGLIVARSTRPDMAYVTEEDAPLDSLGTATFLLLVKDGKPGDTLQVYFTWSETGTSDTIPVKIVDPSSVHTARPFHMKSAVYTCELYTLQGRLVSTFDAGEEIRAASNDAMFSRHVGRGTYIMRLTDIATRKRITSQRLVLQK